MKRGANVVKRLQDEPGSRLYNILILGALCCSCSHVPGFLDEVRENAISVWSIEKRFRFKQHAFQQVGVGHRGSLLIVRQALIAIYDHFRGGAGKADRHL